MSIKRGTGVIRRVHARNYIPVEADARFNECVKSYQNIGLNALGVDSFDVQLYYKTPSTVVCTCKETKVYDEHTTSSIDLPPNLVSEKYDLSTDIRISHIKPLFGQHREATFTTDYVETDDFLEDDDGLIDDSNGLPYRTAENMLTSANDCGICYRTGFVPGYSLYGWDRQLLTTHNTSNIYSYNIDSTTAPHTFNKLDIKKGYVEFGLYVPKYFNKVRYSIRNNFNILHDAHLYSSTGNLLTIGEVKYAASSTLIIRVLAEQFTHVVVEFDLGHTLLANIAQMSRALDWTRFDTLGNLNVILPATVQDLSSEDVIFVPFRNHVLKVTDVPYLRTSHNQNLDWSTNCRILQPTEQLHYIQKQYELE